MAGNPERQRRECVTAALQQCEGALVRYAARMLGDLHSAADVVQHAFLQLCDQNPLPEDPKPWLFKVCHNRILDLLRRQRHSGQSQAADDQLAGPAPDPAELSRAP